MNKKFVLSFFILLFLVNVGIALYIEHETKVFEENPLDAEGCFSDGGCGTIAQSSYSEIFGVKLTKLGLFAFGILSLAFIFLLHAEFNKKLQKIVKKTKLPLLIALALFGGVIFALYFIYLQFFVIGAICRYCMIIDTLTIIAFICYLIFWRKYYESA